MGDEVWRTGFVAYLTKMVTFVDRRIAFVTLVIGGVFTCAPGNAGWITIGDMGNAPQSAANRNHSYSQGDGYGAVDYVYQIAQYAVTIAEWDLFYKDPNSGKVGTFRSDYNLYNTGSYKVGPDAPAVYFTFHQAAQYCNWLTTGNALQGAYTINSSGYVTSIMSHADIATGNQRYYLIPTDNEWFKAAYYDPTQEEYYLFPTGSNTAPSPTSGGTEPSTAVINQTAPAPVQLTGGLSPYGTMGQGGNVWEYMEDMAGKCRGGAYPFSASDLQSSRRGDCTTTHPRVGLRLVAIPEPTTTIMLLAGGCGILGFYRFLSIRERAAWQDDDS